MFRPFNKSMAASSSGNHLRPAAGSAPSSRTRYYFTPSGKRFLTTTVSCLAVSGSTNLPFFFFGTARPQLSEDSPRQKERLYSKLLHLPMFLEFFFYVHTSTLTSTVCLLNVHFLGVFQPTVLPPSRLQYLHPCSAGKQNHDHCTQSQCLRFHPLVIPLPPRNAFRHGFPELRGARCRQSAQP